MHYYGQYPTSVLNECIELTNYVCSIHYLNHLSLDSYNKNVGMYSVFKNFSPEKMSHLLSLSIILAPPKYHTSVT